MPLPNANSTKLRWPPNEYLGYLSAIAEAAIWYGGTPEDLASYYQIAANDSPGSRFWERASHNERSVCVHVPIAASIAQVSAQILFGEELGIGGDIDKDEAAKTRLLEIIDKTQFQARCLEGADVASGLGGVFLKLDYDHDIADYPLITVVHPDRALPEFKWGRLIAVTFWQTLSPQGRSKAVWRHLEYHDKHGVHHSLFEGTENYLGQRRELTEHPETEGLQENVGSDDLNVVYVPNMLPNRRYRGEYFGQQDTANCVTLMEFLDEAVTSWNRDMRLGAARILCSEDYLDVDKVTSTVSFNMEREIFSPLNIDTNTDSKTPGFTLVQPDIRYDAHYRTITEVIFRILSQAGFAPQTFGLGSDTVSSGASGVALKIRERATLLTKGRKERYWGTQLEYLLYRLQVMDANEFDSGLLPYKVTVAFGDSYAPDLLELAQIVESLEKGKGASLEEKIKTLHQEWDDKQVTAEVQRIQGETQAVAQNALAQAREVMVDTSEPADTTSEPADISQ